jgi:hypothetical protein
LEVLNLSYYSCCYYYGTTTSGTTERDAANLGTRVVAWKRIAEGSIGEAPSESWIAMGSCFQSTAVPHLLAHAVSDPPNHYAVNHQHPMLLPEVPVLVAQLCLDNGLRVLLLERPVTS